MKVNLIVVASAFVICLCVGSVEASPFRAIGQVQPVQLTNDTSPTLYRGQLSFNRRASKKARAFSLGVMNQPLTVCALTASNCGTGGFAFTMFAIPILVSTSLTAIVGSIVTLSIKKSRFAMGIAGLVLSSVGTIFGVIFASTVDGGTFGLLITAVTQIPAFALSGLSFHFGRTSPIKRASLSPWFNVSKEGNPSGGLALSGVF